MLPLLAAAWAVGTAKLIAEKTHAIATATTAGDHFFLFVKYDTLPPLCNTRDRDATRQILTHRENAAKVGSLGLDLVEVPLTEIAVARITSRMGVRGRLERARGIAPAFSAWYTSIFML
jgi:hypothetical protein